MSERTKNRLRILVRQNSIKNVDDLGVAIFFVRVYHVFDEKNRVEDVSLAAPSPTHCDRPICTGSITLHYFTVFLHRDQR